MPEVTSSEVEVSKIDEAIKAAEDATIEAYDHLLTIKRELLAKYYKVRKAKIDISAECKHNLLIIVKEAGAIGILLADLVIIFHDAEELRKAQKELVEEGCIEITRPKNFHNQRLVKYIKG